MGVHFPDLLAKVVEEIRRTPRRMHTAVEEECRQVLREVGMKIFLNLRQMFPSLDLTSVLQNIDQARKGDVPVDVEKAINTLMSCCKRQLL